MNGLPVGHSACPSCTGPRKRINGINNSCRDEFHNDPPPDVQASHSTNLAPSYLAEQIFFHVLLQGGKGNPFHAISSEWFVNLAAPKIRELLTHPKQMGTEQ